MRNQTSAPTSRQSPNGTPLTGVHRGSRDVQGGRFGVLVVETIARIRRGHLLPSDRREVGQQVVRHGIVLPPKRLDRPVEIRRVPQRDRRGHQRKATRAMLLRLGRAFTQAPEPMEADSPGKRIAVSDARPSPGGANMRIGRLRA
jgi:hypothetical protein